MFEADLSNKAILKSAKLDGTNLQLADFTDAIIDDADLSGARFSRGASRVPGRRPTMRIPPRASPRPSWIRRVPRQGTHRS